MIGFVWAFLGAVFGAGAAWSTMRLKTAQNKIDINGLGIKIRQIESRMERRWKHMIATQIDTSATLDEAKLHAKLLREDAWRD